MPPNALPLKLAYTFGASKGFEKEISEIRSLVIEWDSSYDSSLRRGYIIELYERNGIFEEFKSLFGNRASFRLVSSISSRSLSAW